MHTVLLENFTKILEKIQEDHLKVAAYSTY